MVVEIVRGLGTGLLWVDRNERGGPVRGEAELRTVRILVVDDDASVTAVLTAGLCRAGFDAIGFQAPEEALADLEVRGGDVLVLDVFMPNLDGFEVMKRLRALARPPRVLVISGGNASMLRAAKLLGADAVLAKPFGLEALLVKLRELLGVG